MYGRSGLDRFKKAQTLEPFSVSSSLPQQDQTQKRKTPETERAPATPPPGQQTQVGGGQSSWQPPDWALEPRPNVFYLEVVKEGTVLDRINLNKRRHIFGRQFPVCDFVLDHPSVSRQHAAVVPHKNGGVYVVDLGSAHGTFVANERVTKDTPVELEAGQSLRFAASTRTYILRKNEAALFPPTLAHSDIKLPPPPDPSDEEAIVAYNTLLNRYGMCKSDLSTSADGVAGAKGKDNSPRPERAAKRMRKTRVAFRDQVGGELVQVVGVSDGADVETEPGPIGLKEGSLVGQYESLVQVTVIPKGKEQSSVRDDNISSKGVTDKLKEVLNKVKNPNTSKSGMYDDLYGECYQAKVGSSWAYSSVESAGREPSPSGSVQPKAFSLPNSSTGTKSPSVAAEDDDDLFGD